MATVTPWRCRSGCPIVRLLLCTKLGARDRSRSAGFVARVFLSLTALIAVGARSGAVRAADSDVRLSSVGYVTGHAKRVSIVMSGAAAPSSSSVPSTFLVRRAADDAPVFTGALAASAINDNSGDQVAIGDFTAIDDTGSFYVDVPGVGRSVAFSIDDDVYRAPLLAAMLGFYGARCGTAVSFSYQGTTFGHGACHLEDGHLDYLGQAGVSRDGGHGWHDAGDYGKYTVNGAFALGMLLSAWERHPAGLNALVLPIPESGGALPDFLAEMKWQADWLLTMQYGAADGRVSHKLTRTLFEDFVMPEADLVPRYFVPYGTAATADFVAALAQASRAFAPFDADFAARCLAAARVSYAYLTDNPANVAADQDGFGTGGYGTTDSDDRLWAAAEIWQSTGDAGALADVEARIAALTNAVVDPEFDWSNTKTLGLFTYLLSQRPGRDPALVARVASSAMDAAATVVANHDASGYGRGALRYTWGSNGTVARTAMVLDVAHHLSGDPSYLDAAVDQLGYLFGRNHYNRSQVTGVGIAPPLTPHHRPSIADGIVAPFPGLLVGGGTTATNWVDDETMFMVNEVAINWNAPLVYALSMFVPGGAWSPVVAPGDGGADGGISGDAGARGDGSDGDAGVDHRVVSGGGCACMVQESAPDGVALSIGGTLVLAAFGARRRARHVRRPPG
jgi:endoglucanase